MRLEDMEVFSDSDVTNASADCIHDPGTLRFASSEFYTRVESARNSQENLLLVLSTVYGWCNDLITVQGIASLEHVRYLRTSSKRS